MKFKWRLRRRKAEKRERKIGKKQWKMWEKNNFICPLFCLFPVLLDFFENIFYGAQVQYEFIFANYQRKYTVLVVFFLLQCDNYMYTYSKNLYLRKRRGERDETSKTD